MPDKGQYTAVVSANKQIGPMFYLLSLDFGGDGSAVFAKATSGQFAELDLADVALPPAEEIPEQFRDACNRNLLLRRPFGFSDVTTDKDKTTIEILYHVVGPSSLRITTLSAGDTVSVIGPLGNGFGMPKNKRFALLVSGGLGAGPLIYLAKELTEKQSDIEVIAFVGAKSKQQLPFAGQLEQSSQQPDFSIPEFAKYGVRSLIATDDGSTGFNGFATDCMLSWLRENTPAAKDVIIYSCGPEAMLGHVTKIAGEQKIDCQISMERRMACGFGICQGCSVECKTDNPNETVYKLCCKDGPVFDSRQVVFKK